MDVASPPVTCTDYSVQRCRWLSSFVIGPVCALSARCLRDATHAPRPGRKSAHRLPAADWSWGWRRNCQDTRRSPRHQVSTKRQQETAETSKRPRRTPSRKHQEIIRRPCTRDEHSDRDKISETPKLQQDSKETTRRPIEDHVRYAFPQVLAGRNAEPQALADPGPALN